MKQNTKNGTYITIINHKHNNKKYIIYKIKQKHTKHTTMYTIKKWKQIEHERMYDDYHYISRKYINRYL